MSDWRVVSTVLAGDSAEYAVNDFKNLFNLMIGGNQSNVIIGSTNKWTFKDNIAQFQNPAGTFEYTIRTSAITADRDLTIPLITANDTFALLGLAQIFNNKTIDAGLNTIQRVRRHPRIKKTGEYLCNSPIVNANGLLEDLQSVGTITHALTAIGSYNWFSSGTALNAYAGVYRFGTIGLTRRSYSPMIIQDIALPIHGSNCRYMFGFSSYNSFFPTSGDPFGSADSGVFIGWRETDTNIMIFVNDGTGVMPAAVDTGQPVPASDLVQKTWMIEMSVTDIKWSIMNASVPEAVLATGTITSRIPALTTNLWFQSLVQNTSTTSKNNLFYSITLEQKS